MAIKNFTGLYVSWRKLRTLFRTLQLVQWAGIYLFTVIEILCVDELHHYPIMKRQGDDVEPLYINSDNILDWGRASHRLYRTIARPAAFNQALLRNQSYYKPVHLM
ncbi:hypothetical protein Plhal304r1_c027g0091501 [Plasmopara halstedii]